MAVLDREIRHKLHEMLGENMETTFALLIERKAQIERERARAVRPDERAAMERDAAKLEAENARLVSDLATGKASPAVSGAIRERERDLEVLRAKLAEPPAVEIGQSEHETFIAAAREWVREDGPLAFGPPAQARQALRKLGIDKIIATPDATGWTFEGCADLGRLLNSGNTAPSETSPRIGCAGAAGARTAVTPTRRYSTA